MPDTRAIASTLGLNDLRGLFVARTAREIRTCPAMVAAIARGQDGALNDLRSLVHKIRGGGAVFRLAHVETYAAELDEALARLPEGSQLTPEEIDAVQDMVSRLAIEVGRIADGSVPAPT